MSFETEQIYRMAMAKTLESVGFTPDQVKNYLRCRDMSMNMSMDLAMREPNGLSDYPAFIEMCLGDPVGRAVRRSV